MVMESDMEEDLSLVAGDESVEGLEESEGAVEEFDLAELRREFAEEVEPGREDQESVEEGEGSGGADDEGSADSSVEDESFGSDRERYRAVIHAAREHGLGIDDLEELERAESRSEVERRARSMSERRTLHRRVEALERQLAPVQQFDSNRPSVPSGGSDEAWIDRYMAGDRSGRAVAAARRAFD